MIFDVKYQNYIVIIINSINDYIFLYGGGGRKYSGWTHTASRE